MTMKKILTFTVFCLLNGTISAQWSSYYFQDENKIDGGLGMTWIDNKAYYTIYLQPDISIGKFGVGLGITLLYDAETGRIRSQDWNSGYDYARLIRYLRYGHKGDTFYSRIGALDYEMIGHGFILNFYNNQVNYDRRKLGLTLDADFGHFGFESLTNNLGRLEVIGGRGYFRPIYSSEIPVLRNVAVGASFVTDVDPDSRRDTEDNISIWGVDIELPLIKSDLLTTLLFADYAQIQDYGSGQTIGLRTDFNALMDFLKFGFSIERQFLGKEFIANYFGPFYEILRYTTMGELVEYYESLGGNISGIPPETLPIVGKNHVNQHTLLPMMTEKRRGWFGVLYMDFLHLIRVMGFYQKIDNQENSGILHLGAVLSPSIPFLALEATYDKRGIHDFEDIRTLDYRSVARVGIGYKIKPYLLLYMDYIWNFEWDENLKQYKPQERFQPRLAFRYHFGGM